jgi:putative addiction module CopG family antidote
MKAVTLPPNLEQFASEAVAAGRYRDMAEVVAAGVSLSQRGELERAAFVRSLEAAEAEADCERSHSLDHVVAEAERISAAKRGGACGSLRVFRLQPSENSSRY